MLYRQKVRLPRDGEENFPADIFRWYQIDDDVNLSHSKGYPSICVSFYLTSDHVPVYVMLNSNHKQQKNCRFIPGEVDHWFRLLIKDLKHARKNQPPPNEDILQMILKMAEKTGKFETECNQ